MTVTTQTVTVTVDGVVVEVPAGTLIIRVAEMLGTAIPRFCDHPLLEPVAACRMCLVEIEGQGKPQPSWLSKLSTPAKWQKKPRPVLWSSC